jgi:O-acetyl-ADP-ribose deacetylase (regulator of RNase III)
VHAQHLQPDSIAFPGISTGVYGYPVRAAARVAVRAVVSALDQGELPERVVLCAYDDAAAAALRLAMREERR